MVAELERRDGLPWTWGSPVDMSTVTVPSVAADCQVTVRCLEVKATPGAVFTWVCQLRRAPYSYDWLDNFGRRSPRHADPSLSDLEIGQSFMTIFELVDFSAGESVTLRMKKGWPSRVFGTITLTYHVQSRQTRWARLAVLMWMPPIGPVLGRARRYLLAWGDLLMMRKQLRTLAGLAERGERRQLGEGL